MNCRRNRIASRKSNSLKLRWPVEASSSYSTKVQIPMHSKVRDEASHETVKTLLLKRLLLCGWWRIAFLSGLLAGFASMDVPAGVPGTVQLAIQRRTNDLVLTLSGTASQAYALEESVDLRNWTALATNRTDESGYADWHDSLAVSAGDRRFYRARSVAGGSDPGRLAVVYVDNLALDQPIFFLVPGNPAPLGLQVQLLGGPPGGPLTPVYQIANHQPVVTIDQYPSYFDGGAGVIAGVIGGEDAQLQLQAWLGADTYATAILRWESPVWQQSTGTWDSTAIPPQPPSPQLLAIPGLAVIQPIGP
jgi:hypothetical protein